MRDESIKVETNKKIMMIIAAKLAFDSDKYGLNIIYDESSEC